MKAQFARARGLPATMDSLLADAAAGGRLAPDDGLALYAKASLHDLGRAADMRRKALHRGDVVTYIVERNVNYTNVCTTACKFCNFFRPRGKAGGYTLSRAELSQKLQYRYPPAKYRPESGIDGRWEPGVRLKL